MLAVAEVPQSAQKIRLSLDEERPQRKRKRTVLLPPADQNLILHKSRETSPSLSCPLLDEDPIPTNSSGIINRAPSGTFAADTQAVAEPVASPVLLNVNDLVRRFITALVECGNVNSSNGECATAILDCVCDVILGDYANVNTKYKRSVEQLEKYIASKIKHKGFHQQAEKDLYRSKEVVSKLRRRLQSSEAKTVTLEERLSQIKTKVTAKLISTNDEAHLRTLDEVQLVEKLLVLYSQGGDEDRSNDGDQVSDWSGESAGTARRVVVREGDISDSDAE
ncbi:hypothetical protein BCR39DRAFT_554092 [Naematelia encephala]|uniref:Uncharacterized protein n=1 Tax=Naematelia encephala TaxID=71784 RepID=A0A1Y2AF46_9TREE|nr:hypothetical protein BCR39DRAFT_554092 [Naematelia encephala]